MLNPTILEASEVHRQYGPESPVILDRCFYLGTLPRPDLGLSQKATLQIKRIAPGLKESQVNELRRLFRAYKEGKVEGDNLVEEMVSRVGVKAEQATSILNLFPELVKLQPIPTNLILRSHMTALWFPVLSALKNKRPLPIKLFSIGPKYRREQRLDALHLYESLVASIVVMDEDVTLEDGRTLTKIILSELGFTDARFDVKKATSKYYAPGTEMEVFVKFGEDWVEIGDQGLYSPVALAEYGISWPVFNVGLGVERIAMLIHGEKDIRRMAFPQFYEDLEYTDEQIAKMVEVAQKPTTSAGLKLLKAIVRVAAKHGDADSPCEFLVYKDEMLGREVEVHVYEYDTDTKLLGPAALNTVYIYQGNILGIPQKGLEMTAIVKEARENGVSTGISYLEAAASLAAYKIEEMARRGQGGKLNIRVKIAKLPSDVNIRINSLAEKYITGKKKRIIIKGPTFIGIRAKIL